MGSVLSFLGGRLVVLFLWAKEGVRCWNLPWQRDGGSGQGDFFFALSFLAGLGSDEGGGGGIFWEGG